MQSNINEQIRVCLDDARTRLAEIMTTNRNGAKMSYLIAKLKVDALAGRKGADHVALAAASEINEAAAALDCLNFADHVGDRLQTFMQMLHLIEQNRAQNAEVVADGLKSLAARKTH